MAPLVSVRVMVDADLDAADRLTRLAFGTIRGLADPSSMFGDTDRVRTRFRAAPDCAWVAEVDGEVVGSAFAACWGSFGFVGPIAVHPEWWDRGIGSELVEPALAALVRWEVRQAGLFTFPNSAKHLGLYQKHGFWPRFLTAVLAMPVTRSAGTYTLFSQAPAASQVDLLAEIRELTDDVFPGLDVEREVMAVRAQEIGDTVLVRTDGRLAGMAVCHCGAGSEAGSDTCYAKFGAVRPGVDAGDRFEDLLDACQAFAAASDLGRLVAGVNTGRLDAYRRLLRRGFRADLIGVSMQLWPERPDFDSPDHYVIDDLR